ncbi:MAG TPA: MXAN_6640 family putative metalloprotease [Dongiaceae bacterium]|nr:MXAN_6640 family putative metalloprotease [Dongiaceae bacterium]
MEGFRARIALAIVILLQFSSAAFAGPLDDYYLQQFGETKNIPLQKAMLSVSPDAPDSARCGMPLKHGLKRDWNLLESSTQKVLAKQLALPTLLNEKTFDSAGGHFRVHYAATGSDAPSLIDITGIIGVPDWVETVAATFENVYANYSTLGYQHAPTTGGAPYNLYLRDLAPEGYYGITTEDQPAPSANYPNGFTSFMEIDNNFTDPIFRSNSPLQSLQITAAHEYHHAIQYGYNFYFDIWYAEATSTWMEDELYDSVNQLYNYIPAWFANTTTQLDLPVGNNAVASGAGYGRWIFNRFLAEKHNPVMIRNVWEKVGTLPIPDSGTDISMIPVLESVLSSPTYGTTLSSDFFAFAQRVYTRDWAANPHSSDTAKIHAYSPVATYSAYPVDSSVSSPAPSVSLPHYSFAYYKFTPRLGVPSLTITIAKSSGIRTAVFRKSSGTITEITANSGGNSYTDNTFGSANELVLLVANITGTDGENANFSTDGKTTAVVVPPTQESSTSGNTASCFIATAAYGSYLHPQVQLLRNFRDEYLLTNAPGRAFVALYYRRSPPLADFIARHTVLRGVTRLLLTPLVIAIVHPLISAISLFLLTGGVLVSRLRRKRAARSIMHPDTIRTTSHF